MRIKSQLMALVAGTVLPLALLAGFLTYQLCQQQRQAYQQQFLERASAVRLALDTEFDAVFRILRATGDGTEIPPGDAETVLLRRFRGVLDNYPDWAALALTDAQGRVTVSYARSSRPAPPVLDEDSIRRSLASGTGAISNVLAAGDGGHFVYVATPVVHEGATLGLVYAAIEHSHWLDLLRTYPVSKRGTLTLMDRSGTVIARTLNDAQWAGKKARADYWAKITGQAEGAFKTLAVDGTPFYAAFSRSTASGWVLATGVPQDEVDQELYWKSLAVMLICAVAMLGALLAAWRLGKAINVALVGLLHTARTLSDKSFEPGTELPIREARTVRNALVNARDQLLAREAALSESLEREASARQQAENASRARDQFLAMLGHELRNPVGAITAAVDILGTGNASPVALSRSRDIVKRQTDHLAAMINDLMDVAQLDSGEMVLHKTHLDLARVAAKVLTRFEDTGRCTHLQMRTEHVPAWINADEARLELLITCLLDNACKYTPPGGTVMIEVKGEPDRSVLRIKDTGAGIAADVAKSMFDAFTQGQRSIDRSQGGLGLGLAIAQRLTLLHDGAISASSDGPGHGAAFTVTFPAAEPPLPELAASKLAPSNKLLITIVEDIADNREALMLLLEAQGRRINEAVDGPSGVQMILSGPSDVALVDIGLPGFDGLEVARRVRQDPAGAKVVLIALTGYGTQADRARAFDAGFDAFIIKPFDPDSFEAVCQKALDAKGL